MQEHSLAIGKLSHELLWLPADLLHTYPHPLPPHQETKSELLQEAKHQRDGAHFLLPRPREVHEEKHRNTKVLCLDGASTGEVCSVLQPPDHPPWLSQGALLQTDTAAVGRRLWVCCPTYTFPNAVAGKKKLHLNFQMHEMNRHGNLARNLYSELTWLGMAFSSARTFYFYFLFLNYGDSGPCETNPLTKLTPICHQEETRTLFMVGWEKHWFPLCFTGMIWKKAMRSVSKLIPHNKSFIPEQSATALWFCLILSNWCCVPESTELKPSSRACKQQWAGMGALSLQWHSLTPSPCHTNREPSFRPTACPTFALSRRKQNLTCGPRGRGSALPRGALLWPPRQQPTWGPHCTLTKDSPANSQPIHSQRCSLRTLNYRGGGRRWWSSDPQVGSICWACGNCKKERQRTGISRCSLFRGQISKIEIYESQRAYSGTRSSLLT